MNFVSLHTSSLDFFNEPGQLRIQDFPEVGAPTPKLVLFCKFLAENCMKMKEFGLPGGWGHVPVPSLDPPMQGTQCIYSKDICDSDQCPRLSMMLVQIAIDGCLIQTSVQPPPPPHRIFSDR